MLVIKHVAFFTICAKLTLAFTFTSLPLNFYTSVSECGCGFGFEQKYWQIDGFGKKKAQIGGFAYPYSPPSFSDWIVRENLHGFSFTSLRDIASSKAIDIVYTTRKIISAYMKGLSKYRRMAFFFLKYLFLV